MARLFAIRFNAVGYVAIGVASNKLKLPISKFFSFHYYFTGLVFQLFLFNPLGNSVADRLLVFRFNLHTQ